MPIGILIALLLVGGGGGASIAAQSSLPGDTLYPVKIGFNEKIGGAVRFTATSKAEWDSHLAETRLDEVAKLVAENRLNDELEVKLQTAFKLHSDSVEQRLVEMLSGGDAAIAAALAGEFEAGLKTRGEIISRLKADGVNRIKIEAEINDMKRIRKDAEDDEKNEAKGESEGPKNSVEGKIGAASNVIEAVKKSIERIDATSTTTKVEAQAQLAVAESLLAQAKVKLEAKEYDLAFDLAQQALVKAHEAKVTGEIRVILQIGDDDLNDKEDEDDDEDDDNSSSTEKKNGIRLDIEFEGGPKFER